MQIGDLLNKLRKAKRQTDGSYLAICPSHEDKKASLHVTQDDGKILLKCFAGCETESICSSLSIEMSDLFAAERQTTRKIIAEYSYEDEQGEELYQVVRFDPKGFNQRHKNGGGEYVYKMDGVRRVLYHLKEVLAAKQAVYVVEGEKDVDNLRKAGYIATTSPGGAGAWKPEYAEYLTGKDVVIIPDKDKAGYQYARAVRDSITGKVESLKCVILPGDNKDVSDWLQSNRPEDLLSLISDIGALDEVDEVKPTATKTLNGFEFTWPEVPFTIYVDRLTSDAVAIFSIKDRQGTLRHTSQINLMAIRSVSELAKKLVNVYKTDWGIILDFIVGQCYASLRDGGETANVDIEPVTMEIKYLLAPVLPLGEPVTIFTAGGVGKSILADYFAVLVQHGYCSGGGLPFIPRGAANTLILDWESEEETHRRYITAIKRGLGITDYSFIAYRRLENPLSQVIESIQAEIVERQIEFVILDSQMAATAGGSRSMSEAQQAGEYYNLIRSFHCSTLTIDHITKASMSNTDGAEAPYGSIVKYNRSRSQFELRLPTEDEDNDHKEFALIHRKFNLGRKQKPLGISCDFTNDGDKLIKIEYKSLELRESPLLSKTLPLRVRAMDLLKDESIMTSDDMASRLGCPKDTLENSVLYRYKDIFTKPEKGMWGLKYNGYQSDR